MDDRVRGVASVAPRRARAACACATRLCDGIHHGVRLLERCVTLSSIALVQQTSYKFFNFKYNHFYLPYFFVLFEPNG